MKKRVLYGFIFICSLTLNAVLVGIWLAHFVPNLHTCHTLTATSAACKKCPMQTKLGLSDSQWVRLEPRLAAFHKQTENASKEISDCRLTLIGELEKPQQDSIAIARCLERIQNGQSAIQKMVVNRILDEKDILTPGQRINFFKMMRHTMANSSMAGMMGSMPLECGKPGEAAGACGRHEEDGHKEGR
jgi:hypothetical protein